MGGFVSAELLVEKSADANEYVMEVDADDRDNDILALDLCVAKRPAECDVVDAKNIVDDLEVAIDLRVGNRLVESDCASMDDQNVAVDLRIVDRADVPVS